VWGRLERKAHSEVAIDHIIAKLEKSSHININLTYKV
jgi:hypothetical protein